MIINSHTSKFQFHLPLFLIIFAELHYHHLKTLTFIQ